MPLERVLDDPALDASAAAVDQPDLPQARFVRRAHVFVDHRCHIARGKGVQIEDGLDRETVGHTALRRANGANGADSAKGAGAEVLEVLEVRGANRTNGASTLALQTLALHP